VYAIGLANGVKETGKTSVVLNEVVQYLNKE